MNLKEAQKAMIDGEKVKPVGVVDIYMHFNGRQFIYCNRGHEDQEVKSIFEACQADEWEIIKPKPKRSIKMTFDIMKLNDDDHMLANIIETNIESYDHARVRINSELPDGKYEICKIYEVSHD